MNNLPTTARPIPAPLPDTIPESCRGVPFMSSLEIAHMTGKRHDHVMRDIDRELTSLGEAAPKFGASYRGKDGTLRLRASGPGLSPPAPQGDRGRGLSCCQGGPIRGCHS
ncbi:hypothetical protein C5F46_08510 [Phaeovulum veldkampii DSM 11550]|uniref:Rha family transcriptional regulator n=1 Tax=Phaeovulum veldkampii DSM 11550 TaxID=1185920 RepID=A0A2T4JI25_9RHOB|nr:hypothetical protein C5F46_08510 [Phaeovulum veldkampii DSM 11550]